MDDECISVDNTIVKLDCFNPNTEGRDSDGRCSNGGPSSITLVKCC